MIRSMEHRPTGPVRIPEGMWVKCVACKEIIYYKEVERRFKVCPKCDYHFRLTAAERIDSLLDPEPLEEFGATIRPKAP